MNTMRTDPVWLVGDEGPFVSSQPGIVRLIAAATRTRASIGRAYRELRPGAKTGKPRYQNQRLDACPHAIAAQ
jgi:hypothetical protein